MKKHIAEWTETILLIFPLGWVLCCFDGGWRKLETGDVLGFVFHLVCACFVALLLLGLGLGLAGQTMIPDEKANPLSKPLALVIEVVGAFMITSQIL